MANGRDTMINENTREEITAGDGLQLGHTSVDQSEMQTVEDEVRDLEERVEQVRHRTILEMCIYTCNFTCACTNINR